MPEALKGLNLYYIPEHIENTLLNISKYILLIPTTPSRRKLQPGIGDSPVRVVILEWFYSSSLI